MMEYSFGNYGFLTREKMREQPLILLDLGVERRCRETYDWDNLKRPAYGGYLFQYTLKGCGIYEADGKKYLLKEGCAFFIKMPENSRYYLPCTPQDFELYRDLSADAGWEFFYLHFDGPAALPFYQTVRDTAGPVFSLSPALSPVRLFLQLFDSCKRYGSLELYEGGEFLYRFLSQLLRPLEMPADGGSALIRQASAYFKSHFSSLSGIGEAAEACGVSQEHLTRCFKRETNRTPLQYLTGLRLENALFLLLNTNDSIEAIAKSCGFLNGNYFAKVFRRHLQCSPEEYRRRRRG